MVCEIVDPSTSVFGLDTSPIASVWMTSPATLFFCNWVYIVIAWKKKPFSFCYFYIIFWNSLFFTFLKIVWSQQNNSEKRFVLNEMLQYLPYTIYRKYFVVFFVFHFVQLYFYLYECIIYKGKSKVAQNLISKMSTDFL